MSEDQNCDIPKLRSPFVPPDKAYLIDMDALIKVIDWPEVKLPEYDFTFKVEGMDKFTKPLRDIQATLAAFGIPSYAEISRIQKINEVRRWWTANGVPLEPLPYPSPPSRRFGVITGLI